MIKEALVYGRDAFLFKAIFVLSLSMALLISTAEAQQYGVTAIGTLGGYYSGPSRLDNQGNVVGGSTIYTGAWHAFSWNGNQLKDLGVPDDYLVSSAIDLNSNGRIVAVANGEYQSQFAYLWENETWSYLGTLPGPGLDYSVPTSINDNSQVTGFSFTLGPGSSRRGWIWENDVMSDLGTLGGDVSQANAINEQGQIVGYSQIDNPNEYITHAFIWDDGNMTDLGVLPGEVNSSANDINESGQAVGSSSHIQPSYPFLTVYKPSIWDDGNVTEMVLPQGYVRGAAIGINENGTAVGWMATSLTGGTRHAFIWKEGVLMDLNFLIPPNSGWQLYSATDINDNGQIVGEGLAPEGWTQAYILTPLATGVEDKSKEVLPTDIVSSRNYPNPFNAATTISYSLPRSSDVSIEIYDILGRKVVDMEMEKQEAGEHQITWNADDQPSGLYFYRIQAGELSVTSKMALLK